MERLSERFMYYCGILAGHRDNPDIRVDDLKHIQNLIDLEEQGLFAETPCKVGGYNLESKQSKQEHKPAAYATDG